MLFVILCTDCACVSHADTASDLQQKITERNAQIKQLEDRISTYSTEITQVGKQASSLKNVLKILDITQKKLSTDITATNQKLNKTNLTLEQIKNRIDATEQHINRNRFALTHTLQNIQSLEGDSVVVTILSAKNVRDVWDDIETTTEVQAQVKDQATQLIALKSTLTVQEQEKENQKNTLVNLTQDLKGKKQAVDYTKQQKNELLTKTKNKEQTYKQLIAVTEKQKTQFEKDVFEFESQLKLFVDPNGYPSPRHGILFWPLENISITQLFGKTIGAEKLYVSGSHNGVDFRASIGTRVKNVLDGVVVGTGNTDTYPGCYSFGKWVMVKHENGLSSIYGHLSVISTSRGDNLHTGDLVGYSGNTGYSTGPHLHVGIYATQGVRIEQFVNSRGCKQAIIPLADIKAYLDPMKYFPVR